MGNPGRDEYSASGLVKAFSSLTLPLVAVLFAALPLADATAYLKSDSMSAPSSIQMADEARKPMLLASEGGHRRRPSGPGWGIGITIRLTPRKPAKVKDPFDDDFFKDEPPPQKKAPSQPQAPTTAETRPEHPETEGSSEARSYLLESAMGFGRELADAVWDNPRATLKKYKAAAKQVKTKQDTEARAEAETSLGHVYYLLGLFGKSEKSYQDALKSNSQGGDPGRNALLVNNLGAVNAASGRYEEALEYYKHAMEQFRTSSNPEGQGMTLNNLGVLHKNRGQLRASLSNFQDSLNFSQLLDELKLLTLSNMAETYRRWGLYQPAEESLTGALEIASKIKSPEAQVEMLMGLAEVYRDWGKGDQAIATLETAITTQKSQGERLYRVNNLMGLAYLDLGQVGKAEQYLKKAKYNSSLGRLYLMKSNFKEAKRHYEKLMASALKYNRPRDLLVAFTGLGMVHEKLGKLSVAQDYYAKGMNVAEDIRSGLLLSERRNFFVTPIKGFVPSDPAKGLIRVRIKRKKGDKSIYASEATRARMFADTIAQKADVSKLGVSAELIRKEERLANHLAALNKGRRVVPRQKDPGRFDAISRKIRKTEKELKSFVDSLWAKHMRYAAVRSPRPVKLKDAAIGPDEHVILFDLLGEGIGVKLIRGNKVILSRYLKWNADQLRQHIEEFRKPFETAKLGEFNEKSGRILYDKLLSVALQRVPKGKPIVIIPDGILALLPFEALVVDGRVDWKTGPRGPYPAGLSFMGDRYPITYYQSITAMTLSRTMEKAKPAAKRVLVMADPVFRMQDPRAQASRKELLLAAKGNEAGVRLMAEMEQARGGLLQLRRLGGTAELAGQLEKLYGDSSAVYTGLLCTKGRFLEQIAPSMDQFSSIVFATHGFAGNNIPGIMEPALALTMVPPGTDGFLTVSDVASLNMNSDVAALTACQTGLGISLAGEGVMSMGRAFQVAGARSVLMSLWSVAESSSVILMEEFFKGLKEGKGKLQAWTEARAKVRSAGFEHPFYWAPFVLVGEFRQTGGTEPSGPAQAARPKGARAANESDESAGEKTTGNADLEVEALVKAGQRGTATVSAVDRPDGCLRIRAEPSTTAEQVGCAAMGETLRLAGGRTDKWIEIEEPARGWVYASQVRSNSVHLMGAIFRAKERVPKASKPTRTRQAPLPKEEKPAKQLPDFDRDECLQECHLSYDTSDSSGARALMSCVQDCERKFWKRFDAENK